MFTHQPLAISALAADHRTRLTGVADRRRLGRATTDHSLLPRVEPTRRLHAVKLATHAPAPASPQDARVA